MKNNFKKIRESTGASMTDVANNIDISVQRYSNYEKGTREADYDILSRLADYYEVSIDYLLGRQLKSIPLTLADEDKVVSMPLQVFGSGGCGNGKNNNDFVPGETFNVPVEWIKGNIEDYALGYACGDSMVDAHIVDGAILFFRKQNTIENNQIGLFHLNGEELIKRYKKLSNSVLLISANSDYEDIEVTEDDEFEIRAKLEREVIFYN